MDTALHAKIKKIVTASNPVADDVVERLLACGEAVDVDRGERVDIQGQIGSHVYFILSGVFRLVHLSPEGEESTVCFGIDGDFMASAHSFFDRSPSMFSLESCSDSHVFRCPYDDFRSLLHSEPELMRWFSMLMVEQIYMLEERYGHFSGQDALNRYRRFVELRPEILRNVAQKHIASYLGITSEHLSRIRRKLR